MKAFVIRGKHDAALQDVPAPQTEAGEALVRVRACGVCGSDLHAYLGHQPFFKYPQIPGHEVVGDIIELRARPEGLRRLPGRPVEENLQPGDRVVLDPAMPCGECYPCTHGHYNCCDNMRVVGVHAPGAMAEYYTAPLECLHRVPQQMPDSLAALVEPVSIGVQANERGRVAHTDTVLVIGAGTIGLCVMLVAKSRGAKVVMSDLSAERLRTASRMGADAVLDPRAGGFRADLAEVCQTGGPSVVVEAVGTPATAAQALDLVAASGRVVLLGLISDEIRIPGNILVKKQLDFVGSRLHGGTIPRAVELLSDRPGAVEGLITHTVGLGQAEASLKMMAARPDQVL